MTTWTLDVQRGWQIGLALTVALGLVAAGAVIAAIRLPLAFWTFLLVVVALLAVSGAVVVGYRLRGLTQASYAMDRNALVIHWGGNEHQIPMAAVRGVQPGSELTGLKFRRGLRWPGHYVGFGEAPAFGPILFYATQPPAQQVIIRTEEMAYAISPADLEGFLTTFRERLEMGPTQEVKEVSTHPAFLDWVIWRDPLGLALLSSSTLLLFLLVGMLCSAYPYLPAQIALRVDPLGEAQLVAAAGRIFYFPVIGAIFLLVNGGLGGLLYRRERMAVYFLWGGLLMLQGLLWAAVLSVLLSQ